jgi:hypothetical protein
MGRLAGCERRAAVSQDLGETLREERTGARQR